VAAATPQDLNAGRRLAHRPRFVAIRLLAFSVAEAPAAYQIARSKSGHGSVVVRGAREHNLKNIDVEIPHERFTVITGYPAQASQPWPSI